MLYVGAGGGAGIVRDHDDGLAELFVKRLHQREDFLRTLAVEVAGRLIGNQHGCTFEIDGVTAAGKPLGDDIEADLGAGAKRRANGILERRPYAEHTSRELYEYRLTNKGRELFPIYAALMAWGNRWTGLPAPPVDLLHKPCGERITARVVCSHCGEDLDVHDTEPVVGRGLIMHRGNRT